MGLKFVEKREKERENAKGESVENTRLELFMSGESAAK
jgi:hypothetical protein